MSTLKSINIIHPSGSTNNIVNDSSGNVTVGNNLYVTTNVGIGTSSPGAKLEIATTNQSMKITGSGDANWTTVANTSRSFNYGVDATGFNIYDNTAASYRMIIDSSGNLLVGATAALSSSKVLISCSMNAFNGLVMRDTGTVGGNYVQFVNDTPAQAGAITHNGSTTVLYTTSSDYRLKDTIEPMKNALDRVSLLKPVTFKWRSDGSDGEGFIAHELQSVIPGAVSGEKDSVDSDGKPKHQGVDASFVVATLVAAIQELKAQNDELKARVAVLEAK
jgi:hypothetical protein